MPVIILRGIPGSGKSTLARKRWPGAIVFSTDEFWMVDGQYRFDVTRIQEAHGWCLRRFEEAVCNFAPFRNIVVDNTATTISEFAPYAALAQAHNWQIQIVSVMVEPEVALARQTHGVPEDLVRRMDRDMLLHSFLIPPRWPHEVVRA